MVQAQVRILCLFLIQKQINMKSIIKFYSNQFKNFSNNELEEKLDALSQISARMYDYRHVFNHDDGEPMVIMMEETMFALRQELIKREQA